MYKKSPKLWGTLIYWPSGEKCYVEIQLPVIHFLLTGQYWYIDIDLTPLYMSTIS